jgi:aldose 1-epimerase
VDGFLSPEDAEKNIDKTFKSAKLSPFVCRLREGKFTHSGNEYKVEKFYLGRHAIHGLIYDSIFEIMETKADDKSAAVKLCTDYKGTDPGYPFSYHITVTWGLESNHKLTAITTVEHTNREPIPIADGWHPYFKMDMPADECTIQFDSDTQPEFDNELLPTGKIKKDNRFLKKTSLKNIELDNSFILDTEIENPACILRGKELQLIISPGKSYPYLQIYIPHHRKSIAVENISSPPDSFNIDSWQTFANPGEQMIFSVTYQLQTLT